MTAILKHPVLSSFQCLGDRCEDTCCQNWSMQVDQPTRNLYATEAPNLLNAIEPSIEAPWIMRKDPQTRLCVKLDGGLCAIHRDYGSRFLSDACHFYPRVTRALGKETVMSATLSCPEIARLSLFAELPSRYDNSEEPRLPTTLKNYLPEGLSETDAMTVHHAFLDATRDEVDAELIFLRIACASRQMENLPVPNWPLLAAFYIKDADLRLPIALRDINDPFNTLHTLCGLIVASHKPMSTRLSQTISDMQTALAATLDWQNVSITTSDASLAAFERLQTSWYTEARNIYTPILRRWLTMQMALHLHPFGGLGATLTERTTLMGMRLAIIKLALASAHSLHGALDEPHIIRIVQSLSRLLDHLGDASFSMAIAEETGWASEARMHGLLRL